MVLAPTLRPEKYAKCFIYFIYLYLSGSTTFANSYIPLRQQPFPIVGPTLRWCHVQIEHSTRGRIVGIKVRYIVLYGVLYRGFIQANIRTLLVISSENIVEIISNTACLQRRFQQ